MYKQQFDSAIVTAVNAGCIPQRNVKGQRQICVKIDGAQEG